jgi:hypothetical protein
MIGWSQVRLVVLSAVIVAWASLAGAQVPRIVAIGASVGGPSIFVIAPGPTPADRQQAISSRSLMQKTLLPALLTGSNPVTVELEPGSTVIKRVDPFAIGAHPPRAFYGDYTVSRIATQRKPDGTDEHLEVFLKKVGQPNETTYNVYDPLVQQLLIAAFDGARGPAAMPVRVDVTLDGNDIATVHLGEKF